MELIRSLSRSYLPFALLLVIFVTAVGVFDSKARESNDLAIVIAVSGNSESKEFERVAQWETTEEEEQKEALWSNDSIYLTGRDQRKKKSWKRAQSSFEIVHQKYGDQPEITNQLGDVSLKLKEYGKAGKWYQLTLTKDSVNYHALLNLGITYANTNQLKSAISHYDRAIQLQPNNPKAWFNKGLLLAQDQRYETAQEPLRKSVELSSGKTKAKAHAYLGVCLLNQNDSLQARTHLEEAVNLYPKYTFPRIHLAGINQSIPQKIEEYKKIIALNPSSPMAHYYLADAYRDHKDYSGAEVHIKKALELNPSDEELVKEWMDLLILQEKLEDAQAVLAEYNAEPDTLASSYFFMAKLKVREKKTEEAIRLYKKAISKSDFNYPKAALNCGVLYKNAGNTKAAIEMYQSAIEMKASYPQAHYNLAILYSNLDSTQAAIREYEVAVAQAPNMYKAWYNLAKLYEKSDKADPARLAYEKAIVAKVGFQKAWVGLAKLYHDQKDRESEAKTYREIMVRFPNYTKAYERLAKVLISQRARPEEAEQLLEKAIVLNPEDASLLVTLGDLSVQMKQADKAIQHYSEAVDMQPKNGRVHYKIGELHMKAGNTQLAASAFNKVIVLRPKSKPAYNYLFTIYNDDPVALHKTYYQYYSQFPDAEKMYDSARELHKLNQNKWALKGYKKAWKQGKKNHWCAYWTGKVYHEKKDYEKAKKYYRTALKKKADHKFSLFRMVEIYRIEKDTKNEAKYAQKLIKLYPDFAKEKQITL